MKTIQMISRLLFALSCAATFVHAISDAWNPATGIFIQRIGTIYDSDPAEATVYYTRYGGVPDRVKSIDYYYDGQGYLDLKNKDTICTTGGADGIIHHPDGDLLVAGQGANTYKVSKAGGANCVVDTVTCSNCWASSYHLMMDPSGNYLWSLGIPGPLVRYPTSNATPGRLANGTRMIVDNNDERLLTTLAWDEKGTTYYTRSGWQGTDGEFGVIDMGSYKTTKWFDIDSGAHGMTFDEYSKTIFIFGNSHIIQIDPAEKKILVDLDMYKIGFAHSYMVSKNGWVNDVQEWRFDQGTTDGKGHLFVASNSGHLVFIDYTSNISKHIDNNILIHAQFIDHWLDDVAPLSGVGSPRNTTTTTTGTSSSSSRVYSAGSYAVVSSSSTGTSSGSTSSGSTSGSNSSSSLSSSSTGGGTSVIGGSSSSSSTGSGTSVIGGSSSSSSTGSGTSVIGGSSSSSSTGSGTSVIGGSSSSDGSGGTSVIGGSSSSDGSGGTSVIGGSSSSTGSGTSVIGGSSSSNGSGGTSVIGGSSSSNGGSGTEVAPWCLVTPKPVGCDSDNEYGDVEYEIGSGDIYDQYPSDETLKKGDSSITQAVLLEPLTSSDPVTGNEVVIGGNRYLETSTGTPVSGYSPSSTGARDSVPVGMVVDVKLDMDKIAEYLGLEPGETVTIHGTSGLLFVDPLDPSAPAASVTLTGDHFWMTANEPISSGLIYIVGPDGKSVIYDGINFYDPIPDAKVALLTDTPDAPQYDAIEVLLADSIPAGYTVSLAQVVVKGVTYTVAVDTLIGDRVVLDASTIKFASPTPLGSSDKVVLTFTKSGVKFVREAPLQLASGHVIKRALVLHNANGSDSLFVEFNFTVTAPDLANIDMMMLVNQSKTYNGKILADRVRLPAKTLVLFDGVTQSCATSVCKLVVWKDSLGAGTLKDSIQLSELAVFANMPYITTDEFGRKVPIEVVPRLPATEYAEYFDNNGDGTLDSVVVTLAKPVDANDLNNLYFAFPWYSSANRLIQLQPQPKDLVLDASNRTRIGWKVQSNVTLRRGLTSIPSTLPLAELYANYPVLDNTFQDERHFPIKDKMAPAIYEAHLRYGEVADSLQVTFSEAVDVKKVSGLELFDYLHGTDTLHLEPLAIRWSDDGLNAWVVLPDGENRIIPGDSLILVTGVPGKVVVDVLGNMPGRNPSPVEIQGSLTHLVSSVDMGSFDPRNDSLRVASSISLTQVPGSTRTSDLREKGALGHIVELGQRFVPQLVKNATTGEYATVSTDIDIEKVFISLQVQYFDHLGQYVTDTTIVLPCSHAKFGGNCLDTDQKLFVNWNYKNKDGRFVGSGVYMVQFKMLVQYEANTIKEEMLDKWGVRRKNK